MKYQSYGILSIFVICLYVEQTVSMDHKCADKMTPEEKKEMMATVETCKKKTGLTEFPKMEDLEKNGFDDKCFAKCMLTEKKILNDKNVVDMKAVEEFVKKVPADKQAEVSKLWESCADSIKKTMDAEGGVTEKNACKAAAMMKHCFMQGAHKMC